jgi:phage-related protein
MPDETPRPLYWISSSRKDMRGLPVTVLLVFQKKSKHGIATPKHEIDLIHERLKLAQEYHAQLKKETKL